MIKLDGNLSPPFTIKQGVRNGGILSSSHYKSYNYSLQIEVEDRFTGKLIGTTRIPHVTFADYMFLIIEEKTELQPMVYSAELHANREHFTTHLVKIVVQYCNVKQEPLVTFS